MLLAASSIPWRSSTRLKEFLECFWLLVRCSFDDLLVIDKTTSARLIKLFLVQSEPRRRIVNADRGRNIAIFVGRRLRYQELRCANRSGECGCKKNRCL